MWQNLPDKQAIRDLLKFTRKLIRVASACHWIREPSVEQQTLVVDVVKNVININPEWMPHECPLESDLVRLEWSVMSMSKKHCTNWRTTVSAALKALDSKPTHEEVGAAIGHTGHALTTRWLNDAIWRCADKNIAHDGDLFTIHRQSANTCDEMASAAGIPNRTGVCTAATNPITGSSSSSTGPAATAGVEAQPTEWKTGSWQDLGLER